MFIIHLLNQIRARWRYPGSMPEEIASALGVGLSNQMSFEDFFNRLTSPHCNPSHLTRLMPRSLAEAQFQNATHCEKFHRATICSYSFPQGWLEFKLHFDDHNLLRRLYIHHHSIPTDQGQELLLK